MKKKICLMSFMLMGFVSLFTSCVEGDLFDLYDEDGLLIPRSKKSKDLPQMCGIDKSLLYAETFHNNECVACAYKNFKNVPNSEARKAIITARYDEYNDENFYKYRNLVFGSGNIDQPIIGVQYLTKALGEGNWGGVSPEAFAKEYIADPNNSCFSNIAIITDGGTHIAYVVDKSYSGSDIKTFVFTIKDQYTNTSRAHNVYSFSVNTTMDNYSYEGGDVDYVYMNVPKEKKKK